ncbi:MAG: PepSY domain-containing protein [Firmicutes bacterium]|nr:PepSY domain-containing protein [Bacillota bacterium]
MFPFARGTRLKLVLASAALTVVMFPFGPSVSAHEDAVPTDRPHPGAFSLVSSVKVSDEVAARAVTAAREAYHQVLAPYAKITADQARQRALSTFPGAIVRDAVLQAIRQNLVYIVLLEKEQERRVVWVDAGDGKVLASRDMVRHHAPGPGHRPLMW